MDCLTYIDSPAKLATEVAKLLWWGQPKHREISLVVEFGNLPIDDAIFNSEEYQNRISHYLLVTRDNDEFLKWLAHRDFPNRVAKQLGLSSDVLIRLARKAYIERFNGLSDSDVPPFSDFL